MKKVMVFGTFDLFHKGHESYLKQAREYGDHLVAVVARDETVMEVKGRMPQDNEQVRKDNVKKSGLADEVVIGNKGDRYKVLEEYQPDHICLGYDQRVSIDRLEAVLRERGLMHTQVVRLKPYKPEIYKSSKLRKDTTNDSA